MDSSRLVLIRNKLFEGYTFTTEHPDSPSRVGAINSLLESSGLVAKTAQVEPRIASMKELLRVHNEAYISELKLKASDLRTENKIISLDEDTFMSNGFLNVAAHAAGAACRGVELLAENRSKISFLICRPGGHHALRNRSMGFCVFNNVAVAARHAQEFLGFKRVLIIDWDVHHGNGTQQSSRRW